MRLVKSRLVAVATLLALIFGYATPATAAINIPSGLGPKTSYIVAISDVAFSQLQTALTNLGVTPTKTYEEVFAGFELDLTAEQKTYLEVLLPGLQVASNDPVSARETQTNPPWNLSDLDAPGKTQDSNYKYPTSAGSGVRVYVLDTGVSPNSREFGNRLLPGFDAVNGTSTLDVDGHGTHVAGTVASNSWGVAKLANIVPVKVLGNDGRGTTGDLIAGIDWVIGHNPSGVRAVINMSLGADGVNPLTNAAIARAVSAGIFVAGAAGNDGETNTDACTTTPASEPSTFTVGSVDSTHDLSYFSNVGSCVDILAPGENISSLDASNTSAGFSVAWDGTSMATPHVAGAAALYLSLHPNATVAATRTALLGGAETNATVRLGTTNKVLDISFMNSMPVVTTAPSVGVNTPAVIGQSVTATAGVWNSAGSFTVTKRWLACATKYSTAPTTLPSDCLPVPQETDETIAVARAQVNQYLMIEEKATGENGVVLAYSATTEKVSEPASSSSIRNTDPPTLGLASGSSYGTDDAPRISGIQSTTLRISNGIWSSDSGTPTYSYQWYRCSALVAAASATLSSGCQAIPNQTQQTYQVTNDDRSRFLLASVNAQNSNGQSIVYTRSSLQVTLAPTVLTPTDLTTAIEVMVGNRFELVPAAFDASPTPTISIQWFLCNGPVLSAGVSLPAGCSAISGATGTSIQLTQAQRGKFLLASTTAKNPATATAGVTSYSSTLSTAVVGAPAIRLAVTGANGTVRFGSPTNLAQNTRLTVDVAGWVTATGYLYKWYRCEEVVTASTAEPLSCQQITGANAASYTVTLADVGKYVTSYVTARNGLSEVATATVAMSSQVLQTPSNSVAPSIQGNAVVGQTVNANNGTWAATPTATYSYQWYSCTVAVVAAPTRNTRCAIITGARSSSFLIPPSQNNRFLVVQVSAVNAANTGTPVSQFSASSVRVLTAPANTVAPTLTYSATATTGQPIVGSTITVRSGTWTGNPTPARSYRWFACDEAVVAGTTSVPNTCSEIVGATETSLVTSASQQTKFITALETATNSVQASSLLAAVSLTLQPRPIFDSAPQISGQAKSGQTLNVSTGASSIGGPSNPSYLWYRCVNATVESETLPAQCSTLLSATSSSLTLNSSHEGGRFLARVTLTNAAGSTVRFSATTAEVVGDVTNVSFGRPTSTASQPRVGSPLTVGTNAWTGFPRSEPTYQWYRCADPVNDRSADRPGNCVAIGGATGSTYVPVEGDESKYLSVRAVNTQQGGASATMWSPTSLQVYREVSFGDTTTLPAEPTPSIGNQRIYLGNNLTLDAGTTHGFPTPQKTYQWYRCDDRVLNSGTSAPAGCVLLSGETAATYEFKLRDVGSFILASVTLTNEISTARWFTESTTVIGSAPVNGELPAPRLSGQGAVLRVGTVLEASQGTWTALPQANYIYQWYRCQSQYTTKQSTLPNNCIDLGISSSTYELRKADSSRFIMYGVTATNDNGESTTYSPTTVDVGEPTSFTADPVLDNRFRKDDSIGSSLAVAGWPTPTATYRWFRCDAPVAAASSTPPLGCLVIPRATGENYTLTYADVAKYVVKEIRLTNRIDSSVRYTASSKIILLTPEISGNFTVTGQLWFDTAENPKVLTASPATVRAFPETVPVYQWFRGGTAIRGANTTTYTLTAADVGYQLSYTVTATNTSGQSYQMSEITGDEIGQTPRLSNSLNAQKPRVCGTDSDGEVAAGSSVTACPGDWIGTPDVSEFNYQWYMCTAEAPQQQGVPSTCSLIRGATSFEYFVTFKDEGKFIGFTVLAKNGTEDRSLFSGTSKKIYVKPQYLSSARTTFAAGQAAKDGSPRVGYQIEATVGTWRGAITNNYSYQWFACTGSATALSEVEMNPRCEEIFGAESRVLTVTDAMVGKFLGVKITGAYKYNPLSDDPARSNRDIVYTASTTKAVLAPPTNVRLPYITSRYTYVYATLKANDGEWTGSQPLAVSHTWWECDSPIFEPSRTQPAGCREIPNSTGNWIVTPAQVGKYLTSAAKASNMGGDVRIWSATQEVVKTGPVNMKAPEITVPNSLANPSTTTQLSVSKGTWRGDPPPGDPIEYNWYRCDAAVADSSEYLDTGCQIIVSARGSTYTPVADDVRKYLVASVKASNIHGDWVAYTKSTAQVYLPPSNLTTPTVPAEAFVGRTITPAKGTWEGFPEPALTYQWYSCDARQSTASSSLPAGCAVVNKATAETYKPVVSLIDKYLVLRVTAKNAAGEVSSFSASTDSVVSGPVMTDAPTYTGSVEGHPVVGRSTSTDGGIWQGTPEPNKSYQWLVCDKEVTEADVAGQKDLPPVGAENPPSPTQFLIDKGCVVIEGATQSSITPNESFRGKFLMVHVIARNIHGVDDWYAATSTSVWMAPVIDAPVQVTGKTFNLLAAHARLDTWKAFPEPTKTYTWHFCNTVVTDPGSTLPAGCSPAITGATGPDYKIPSTTTPEQKYLVVMVRARNGAGPDGVSYSATSTLIVPGPANTVEPTVTGTATFAQPSPGSVLTSGGAWVNTEGNLRYQWYRCTKELDSTDELSVDCAVIAGANQSTYVVTADDVLTPAEFATFNAEQKLAIKGKTLVVGVTGSNARFGDSTVFSKSTPFVTERVNNVTNPTISGLPRIDTTITGLDGTWRGFPLPTDARRWFVCKTAKPTRSLTKPADCSPIGNSNKATLAVSDDFLGKFLVFSITKTNRIGNQTTSVTIFSPSTAQVALTPVALAKPDLDPVGDFARADAPKVGTKWRVSSSWKKPTPALTYQWYRCESRVDTIAAVISEKPAGCAEIEGGNSVDYEVRVADQGKFLLAAVTGTNVSDAVTTFTNSSERPVAQPPLATTLPVLSGSRNIGDTLSVTEGVWTPQGTEPRQYQWYSCSKPVPETVNEVPSFCDVETGETRSTYQISELDAGSYLTVRVSGTFQFATTSYLLAVTEATQLSPRIVFGGAKPSLDYETFLVGDLFTIKGGEWEGTPEPVKTYKWYRCVNPVDEPTQQLTVANGCTEISGATNPTYNASNADNGRYLVGAEVATNSGGSAVWFTMSSDAQVKAGYVQGDTVVRVTADGNQITPTQNVTITYTPGTWKLGDNAANATLVHRWIYCREPITTVVQKLPTGCDWMFPYKDSRTFLVADEDTRPLVLGLDSPFAGYYIASMEYVMQPLTPDDTIPIAKRETFRVSATTSLILMKPTLWTNPPTTELLSAANGNGYYYPRISGDQYAVGDSGQSPLSAVFIARFLSTTDPWASDVTANQRITWRGVGDPSWRPNQQATTPYGFSTQWFRCETEVLEIVFAQPVDCSEIAGATSGNYTPVEADVNKYLTVRITATNSVGSTSVWTKSTLHITQKVTVKVLPALNQASTRLSGDLVTVSPGEWVGVDTPSDATYKFYVCSTTTVSVASCGASPTNSSLPRVQPSTGRSFTIPSLGGVNLTRYVVVEISRSNYPYLKTDTTYDPSKIRTTMITLATERIYERPVWRTPTSVPLMTDSSSPVLTSATSPSNLNANVGQTIRMDAGSTHWSATDAIDGYAYSWFECTTTQANRNTSPDTPEGCTQIAGADAATLTLNASHVGKKLLGRVIATNRFASGTSWTVTTPPITRAAFNVTPPSISLSGNGKPAVGDTITGVSGTFDGTPNPSEDLNSYQWYACNTAVLSSSTQQAGCTAILGARNSTFKIAKEQMGKFLVFSSGASSLINPNSTRVTTVHFSASVGDVEMDPEFGPTDPLITGTGVDSSNNPRPAVFHVGYTLKLANFSITSNPAATSTWDWYVCDSPKTSQSLANPPSDCVKQDATDQRDFVIASSMVGKYITVFASAVSRTNPTKKNAAFTRQVTMSPLNTAPPVIGGSQVASGFNAATVTSGSWSALPAVTAYSYAWYLCTSPVNSAGSTKPASCESTPIPGANGKSITLNRDWAGKYLVVEETAGQTTNNTGLATTFITKHYSASSQVIKTPPIFSANSSVAGFKHVGEIVSAAVFKNSGFELETETYQWYVCSATVGNSVTSKPATCDLIAGETQDTLEVQPSFRGKYLTVSVTLENTAGKVVSFAASGNEPISKSPSVTAPVTITGDDIVGPQKSIRAVSGTWDSTPTSATTYRWYLCDTAHSATGAVPGDDCNATSASGQAITLTAEHAGKFLQVAETANAAVNKPGAGSAVNFSATMGPIRLAPVFTSVPSMTGVAHVGRTLQAVLPTINSFPDATASAQYSWLACTTQIAASTSSIPAGCETIPNSANADLVLTSAQVGKSIMLLTTYTNTAGSTSRTSTGSQIVSSAPSVTVEPVISGSRIFSSTALASVGRGTWTGTPAPSQTVTYTYGYSWFLCNSASAAADTLDSSCTNTSLGSATSLQLTRNMDGKYLVARVSVTAPTNELGGTTSVRFTAGFGPIAVAATATSDPVISSYSPTVNTALTATNVGTWSTNTNPLATDVYKWYTCPATVSGLPSTTVGAGVVPTSCTLITGFDSGPLQITSKQVGFRILLAVFATNAGGTAIRTSRLTAVVPKPVTPAGFRLF